MKPDDIDWVMKEGRKAPHPYRTYISDLGRALKDALADVERLKGLGDEERVAKLVQRERDDTLLILSGWLATSEIGSERRAIISALIQATTEAAAYRPIPKSTSWGKGG